MRFILALWLAKFTRFILKLLGRNASYFAGKLAIKLCPDFLGRVNKPETIIAVTGTNGKTTVTNLIADALEGMGVKVLSNRFGSNVDAGIATAFASGLSLLGRQKYPLAVLEIDERSARLFYPYVKPDLLLITNLFRDSMRRNAHPYYIADILTEHIPPETKLLLNADDLISACVAPNNDRVYFSIPPVEGEPEARASIVFDARLCPECDSLLEYRFRRYNHIGKAFCSCGFGSPEADYSFTAIDEGFAKFKARGEAYDIRLDSTLIHNAYNSLAAASVLCELGYSAKQAAGAVGNVKITESRLLDGAAGRWKLSLIMAKGLNAVACSRSFDYVGSAPGRNAVILMLDDVFDEKNSSENIAWLYDADFEFLNTENITQIITVGKRSPDSLLRLLLAGVPREKITALPGADSADEALKLDACDTVFVLYELYRLGSARELRERIIKRMEAGETM